MAVTKKQTYLKGLGDLYINAEVQDNPSVTIDDSEDITLWSGVGSASVASSQVERREGAYSVAVTGVSASGDGAAWEPTATKDYTDNEDTLMVVYVYPLCTNVIRIKVYEGANWEEYVYSVTANTWNKCILDLSNPVATNGTVDWSAIDKIEVLATSVCDFYIDGMYFFDSLDDMERDEKIRLGCVQEITLDSADTLTELRCSDNEVVDSFISETTITLTSTIRDYDPAGLALIGGGDVTTDSVTKQVTETTTIPSVAPYEYTLDQAAVLKAGDGFGVWVYKTDSGEFLQESPDAAIIPAGYYYLDTVTGKLTFNSTESGIDVTIVYNVTTSGRTYEAKTDREFKEFSLQFQVRGSNNKTALLFFPRLKSSSFGLAPARDDYWDANFEASVLADETSGNYYEVHVAE